MLFVAIPKETLDSGRRIESGASYAPKRRKLGRDFESA
jgi:hypothetical protein